MSLGASVRGSVIAIAVVLVPVVGACVFLDEPTQCATDGDCVRFDAVCDVTQAVCVQRAPDGEITEGGAAGDTSAPADDAGADPRCTASPKPIADPKAGLPARLDGGAEIATALTLDCDRDWVLDGPLVVARGGTLTIRAGTTVRAKKGTGAAIIVQPGARIVAEGRRDAPIVFTVDDAAPAPGDWRGLYLLGAAPRTGNAPYNNDPTLAFGGAEPEDDSGVLSFVRVEYSADALVLAGVGRKTKVDSVQVRRTNDNCFAFPGGTFDARHLACQAPADEFFELSQGFVGRLQFLFGQRGAAGDGHHGLLVDGATTAPTVSNATFCGQSPAATGQSFGLVFRNDARIDAMNLVLSGWLAGLDAVGNVGAPVQLRGSVVAGNGTNPAFLENGAGVGGPNDNDDNGFDEIALFQNGGNSSADPNLVDCLSPTLPKPWPAAPLTTGAQTPPAGLDSAAVFAGAVRDAEDAWLVGVWTRWSDR